MDGGTHLQLSNPSSALLIAAKWVYYLLWLCVNLGNHLVNMCEIGVLAA